MIPRLVFFIMFPIVATGCGEPAALGEACDPPHHSGDGPACEGDALCITAPGPNDFRCAARCTGDTAGCTRDRCDAFCVPPTCESSADCPIGTACEGQCAPLVD